MWWKNLSYTKKGGMIGCGLGILFIIIDLSIDAAFFTACELGLDLCRGFIDPHFVFKLYGAFMENFKIILIIIIALTTLGITLGSLMRLNYKARNLMYIFFVIIIFCLLYLLLYTDCVNYIDFSKTKLLWFTHHFMSCSWVGVYPEIPVLLR